MARCFERKRFLTKTTYTGPGSREWTITQMISCVRIHYLAILCFLYKFVQSTLCCVYPRSRSGILIVLLAHVSSCLFFDVTFVPKETSFDCVHIWILSHDGWYRQFVQLHDVSLFTMTTTCDFISSVTYTTFGELVLLNNYYYYYLS